jgi:predicted amidohydrolase
MTNIFEQPWLLLIVAGAVFLGVAFFRDLLPPGRGWLFWLLPVVIAILAFAIDYFVRTDKKKIETVLAGACRAVEEEDIRALGPLISKDYHDSLHPSKQALLNHFEERLSEPVIEKIVPAIVSLDINPPDATLVFTARVMFDPKGPVYEYRKMMLFKLQADFTKEGDEWFFSRTEILAIDLQPAGWQHTQGNPGEMF